MGRQVAGSVRPDPIRPGGDPPRLADPPPNVAGQPQRSGRPTLRPTTALDHVDWSASIDHLAEDATLLHDKLIACYGKTTEAPRRARAVSEALQELRRALAGRYFAEGLSKDGMNPYFKPQAETDEPVDAA